MNEGQTIQSAPIAELIGWRWHSRGRMWVPPELDDGLDSLTRPVTVDDMLAWLEGPAGDGWYIHIHNNGQPYNLAEPDERWSVHRSKSGDQTTLTFGPTLRAAVEANVRQVHAHRA